MRPSEKLATIIASIILISSGFLAYGAAEKKFGTEIPVSGGFIKEGIIGYPRFINPVLALTDADKDITNLIYSGLLKATPEGKLIPDLAESVTISEDGLVYHVKIKDDLVFHDNQPITTEDIEFTIAKAADPQTKSVKAASWAGVTIEKINSKEIRFTLKKPYAPFEENLTLGILPRHLWQQIENDSFDVSILNKEPIGSGPYKIKSAKKNSEGVYEHYELTAFDKYALGEPFIKEISLDFYINETAAIKAFESGEINTLGGISSAQVDKINEDKMASVIYKQTLPRIFGLFFNQNSQPIFLHKEVRLALSQSVDREELIREIFKNYGTSVISPIPSNMSTLNNSTQSNNQSASIELAEKTLIDAGWVKSTSTNIYEKKTKDKTESLSFTITTSNSPELKTAAELLQRQWTKIGAQVNIEIFESSDLTQKVIRPRKYNSLLFGQVVGRDIDLYPFWHSSQRVDPGLNISMYANIKADKALEDARSAIKPDERVSAREIIEQEIKNDIPAIFLFSPQYVYLSHLNINNFDIKSITEPSERFMNVHQWYLKTDYVWNKDKETKI